jgi:hypothetical protein
MIEEKYEKHRNLSDTSGIPQSARSVFIFGGFMSVNDWEFWIVGYLVLMAFFLIVFARLSKINQQLDELVERELGEKDCVHCERNYDQSDFQEEIRGDK